MKLEWEKATDTTSPDTEAKKKLKPYFHLGVGDIPAKDKAGLDNKDFVPAGQVVQIICALPNFSPASAQNGHFFCIIFLFISKIYIFFY